MVAAAEAVLVELEVEVEGEGVVVVVVYLDNDDNDYVTQATLKSVHRLAVNLRSISPTNTQIYC